MIIETCQRNISDIENPVAMLDEFLRCGLVALYRELLSAHWYKREDEIVSLFAFGHLAPLLHNNSIDMGQLGIEGRVPQVWCHRRGRRQSADRAQRDLVIWNHRNHGFWRVEGKPDRPFAVMEWKLLNYEKDRGRILAQHRDDIDWLQQNSSLMRVGYAVLVEWPDGLKLRCARIEHGVVNERFLTLPELKA